MTNNMNGEHPNNKGSSSKLIKLLLASTTAAALFGGLYYFDKYVSPYDATPEDEFIGDDGTKWRKLKDVDLIEMFDKDNFEITDDNLTDLTAAKVFPQHFWTAPNSRGLEYGDGCAEGIDFVVLKSNRNDRWFGMDDSGGNKCVANREHNGGWEKWKPTFLGGDLIALKAWNGKYFTCDDRKIGQANRGTIGGWEKFYVFTTSDKDSGLNDGSDYVALKSAAWKTWVSNQGDITCGSTRPGTYEKWSGWRKAEEWKITNIKFDLKNGKK